MQKRKKRNQVQLGSSIYPHECSKYLLMTVSKTKGLMTCLWLIIAHFLAYELVQDAAQT